QVWTRWSHRPAGPGAGREMGQCPTGRSENGGGCPTDNTGGPTETRSRRPGERGTRRRGTSGKEPRGRGNARGRDVTHTPPDPKEAVPMRTLPVRHARAHP